MTNDQILGCAVIGLAVYIINALVTYEIIKAAIKDALKQTEMTIKEDKNK